MPLVKPTSAAITATIDDSLQSDGSLAEALDTSVLWALNKVAVDPLSPTVIATLSGLGRWRAKTVAGTVGGIVQAFVNGNLVAGVLTVTHGLGTKYVEVAVYDDTDTQIAPDFVVLIDANTLTVDLTSFGAIPGTWHAVVLGGTSGGGGGGGSFISVPNVAALTALPTAGFVQGLIVHVQSVWDYWSYDPFDTTSVVDGITVTTTTPPGGRWHRMDIADQLWIQQLAWWIDGAAGNDENDGATPATPLLTHAEYNRRVGGPARTLEAGASSIVITLLNKVSVVVNAITFGSATITYLGTLPPATPAVVAAVTPADPTTQTGLTVDLGAPWVGQKLAHDITNDTWFWGYDDVAVTAQVTPPCVGAALPIPSIGPDPAPGDAVDLYDPGAFAILTTFEVQGGGVGLAPAIILSHCALVAGRVVGSVGVDRCLISSGDVGFFGAVPIVACSAHLFVVPSATSFVEITVVLGGCFFDETSWLDGFAYHLASNFLTVKDTEAFTFKVEEMRLVSSATRPQTALLSIFEGSSLFAKGPVWGTAGSMVEVNYGSQIVLNGATTADFNFTALQIGSVGQPVIPPLMPGLVVPATFPCVLTAQFLGAPFFGYAIEYTHDARIVQP